MNQKKKNISSGKESEKDDSYNKSELLNDINRNTKIREKILNKKDKKNKKINKFIIDSSSSEENSDNDNSNIKKVIW